MLRTERGNHPVLIGPGILHKVQGIASVDGQYCLGANRVLVYMTDGEDHLAKAFSDAYPDAKLLRCDVRIRDNVKRKLSQLGITGEVASEIVFDMFGKKVDGGIVGGLVDCALADEFEKALDETTKRWTDIHEKGCDFVAYILKEKAAAIQGRAFAVVTYCIIHLTSCQLVLCANSSS